MAEHEKVIHNAPVLEAFLSLLERDIAVGNLHPAGELFTRMEGLVGNADIDLDAPIPGDEKGWRSDG